MDAFFARQLSLAPEPWTAPTCRDAHPEYPSWHCSMPPGHLGQWHRHDLPSGKVAFWRAGERVQVW